jgi:NADPH-dependent 2,4-dienoyl-CoA reductase/sulfur reductase-like enzyme
MDRVVVVGAGLGGLRACEGLRARGYGGEIVLVGDEVHPPYDRPPLSKHFLAGEWGEDRVILRKDGDLQSLGLERRLGPGARAVGLDTAGREIELASGEVLGYDGLVLATGSRARALSALESLEEAHVLRTLDDAVALRRRITRPGCRLLVLGGGFIGMEVAATARRLGAEVTVVEMLEAPLVRVLGKRLGDACALLHEEHGVRLLVGTGLETVREVAPGEIEAVLTTGETSRADTLLVGIGASPNVAWLEGSGLRAGPNGVVCDERLRAGPRIVVAGDLASWPATPGGQLVRVEHRTNAAEQGDHAAASLLGDEAAFDAVPYVWSDQYDVKIQLLGLPQPDDECEVVGGSEEGLRFVAVYHRDGLVTGVVGFSMPRQLMRLRPLLTRPSRYAEAADLLG